MTQLLTMRVCSQLFLAPLRMTEFQVARVHEIVKPHKANQQTDLCAAITHTARNVACMEI